MISESRHIIEAPRVGNPFLEDQSLQRFLSFLMGNEIPDAIRQDLIRFGDKISNDYGHFMKDAERNPPRLIQYSPYNERIDSLMLSEGWRYFKDQASIEGLVAIPYENQYAELSRLYYFAKIYMFHPSSGMFTCPIAMTDGCAFLIQNLLKAQFVESDSALSKIMSDVYERLVSRNSKDFWTSGQWMTELQGGSDVSHSTSTIAIPVDKSKKLFALFGYKFFTSSTDSEVAMALAKIPNEATGERDVDVKPSLFLVFTKIGGRLNNIEIVRMKEKLGTRQLPTAELKLNGTLAYLVSPEGLGIKSIAQLVNITRIHNSMAAVASMRRIVNLAKDYAVSREAFGQKLINLPLQVNVLSSLEYTTQGNFLFVMEAVRLLGLVENNKATNEQGSMLRLMVPLVKLFTGKEAVRTVSEGIECFGGTGYMEDSFIPYLLRDVQVTPIWEGTTNIQALDFLRALQKEKNGLSVITKMIFDNISDNDPGKDIMRSLQKQFEKRLQDLKTFILNNFTNGEVISWNARSIAKNFALALIAGLCNRLAEYHGFGDCDRSLREFWMKRCMSEWEDMRYISGNQYRSIKDQLMAEGSFGKDKDRRGFIRPKL